MGSSVFCVKLSNILAHNVINNWEMTAVCIEMEQLSTPELAKSQKPKVHIRYGCKNIRTN
jgi:hypothetical protein